MAQTIPTLHTIKMLIKSSHAHHQKIKPRATYIGRALIFILLTHVALRIAEIYAKPELNSRAFT